jgi:hypothetical protein
MKYAVPLVLALLVAPAFASARDRWEGRGERDRGYRYDRGERYHGRGSDHRSSSWGFGVGHRSGGYHRPYTGTFFGFSYSSGPRYYPSHRSTYRCPPPVIHRPVYIRPAPRFYDCPPPVVYYPPSRGYFDCPPSSGYSTGAYFYYGR